MTVLSGNEILELINQGRIKITSKKGFDIKKQIGPASIDLHLGNDFLRFQRKRFPLIHDVLDLARARERQVLRRYGRIKLSEAEGFEIRPGEVILSTTEEFIEVPNDLCCQVTGRSSYSRLGLEVQCTQDHIVPGHKQNIPLQLVNNAPFGIQIYPYLRICQLIFFRLSKETIVPYDKQKDAKYLHETDVRESRFYQDSEIVRLQQIKAEAKSKKVDYGALKLIFDIALFIIGSGLAIVSPQLPLEFGSLALFVGIGLILLALIIILYIFLKKRLNKFNLLQK